MEKQTGIGICMGASTITVVSNDSGNVSRVIRQNHGGNPKATLLRVIKEVQKENESIMVTGRKLRTVLGLPNISEPTAIARALEEFPVNELPQAIVSLGGQTIMVYEVAKKQIVDAHTFNKCGSGTGDFFLQQIKRLGFNTVEDAMESALVFDAINKPYVPASRCSVFCKSDCTHASNEGKATGGQIVAGLCKMIAEKVQELIAKIHAKKIWLIGGGSKLQPVVHYLASSGIEVTVPLQAEYFEAWGASMMAINNADETEMNLTNLPESFMHLPPLETFRKHIEYKSMPRENIDTAKQCLLAVDVGSTTTKMVLLKWPSLAIVADYYGYTLGKPIDATRVGLKAIKSLAHNNIEIVGIIVTGSGRYLVEAYLTDFLSKDKSGKLTKQATSANEITCHAKAGEYFNPGVSCILEIGGQDAKYTYLENGVPIDFCMNEACSAGTGSFLFEVVEKNFGIKEPREIAPLAIDSISPLQFGERCSAFIEADICTALQEGATPSDVIAGLCYSICFNYLNRVVGNRPVTGKISLQGGTAYNKAFCLAMAGVLFSNGALGKDDKLIVPDDAGLMGAIGAGLELKDRIERNEYQLINTTLNALLSKTIDEGTLFECKACDYHCQIRNYKIDGQNVPFGGFCRRYENIRRQKITNDTNDLDLTITRDKLLFEHSWFGQSIANAKTIGICGNFFDLTYLSFYTNFFAHLGFKTIMADAVSNEGSLRQGAPYCWPMERMHGLLADLIDIKPDFFWLPHLKAVSTPNAGSNAKHCCPFVQGSPYVLSTAFFEIDKSRILKPYLDLSAQMPTIVKQLETLAKQLDVSKSKIQQAIKFAWRQQEDFFQALKMQGEKLLTWLKENPDKIAFVLFGRPYNAFSNHLGCNKGIPRKIAALGIPIIPIDMLNLDEQPPEPEMYWSAGQTILKGARLIANNPQLYGIYLENFSCGPDSFINFKFRYYMGNKPSLTMDFDGHTATAGIDTRIEAFIDIVKGFRKSLLSSKSSTVYISKRKIVESKDDAVIVDSKGNIRQLTDPEVRLVIPDMGQLNTQGLTSVAKSFGINSYALPPADERALQIGKKYSSCKECLPYNLTLGSLFNHLNNRPKDEITAYFMPGATGPCRFGQYNVFTNLALEKIGAKNITVMTLTSKNGYSGLGNEFSQRAWIALTTSACMENIYNALTTLAIDKEYALEYFGNMWKIVNNRIESGVNWKNFKGYLEFLRLVARELKEIPLKKPLAIAPKILVTGEIYVRMANITTQTVVNHLSSEGFVIVREPTSNWFKYVDEVIKQNLTPDFKPLGAIDLIKHRLKMKASNWFEQSISQALATSGLCDAHTDNIESWFKTADYINPKLTGEGILTVGGTMHDVFSRYAGVVVVGPFGCLPTRIAQGILAFTATSSEKIRLNPGNKKIQTLASQFAKCPVLFIESDGSALPPNSIAQLEVFSQICKKVGIAMIA